MPCESGPSYGQDTYTQLNKVTRLLCEACKSMNSKAMSPELKNWWTQHKKDDAARRAAEKRREATAKAAREKQYLELKKEFEC